MTRKELPAPETDVYDDFPGFLQLVVEWLTRRKKNGARRDGAAWKVIRTASLRDDKGVMATISFKEHWQLPWSHCV